MGLRPVRVALVVSLDVVLVWAFVALDGVGDAPGEVAGEGPVLVADDAHLARAGDEQPLDAEPPQSVVTVVVGLEGGVDRAVADVPDP